MEIRVTRRMMQRILKVFVAVGIVTLLLPMTIVLLYKTPADKSRDRYFLVGGSGLKKLFSIENTKNTFENNGGYDNGSPHRAIRYKSHEEFCEHHSGQTIRPEMFRHIIVNDKYKLIYCSIPKVACTNWRRIMLILTGTMNTSDPMKIKANLVHNEYDERLTYLSDLSVDEIKQRLKTHYKFVFTRDPFERILSAYRNKFKGKNPFFHSRYGKNIVRRYRADFSGNPPTGADVSFYEFVQYLTDFTRREALNEHWEKMTSLCHPCLVKYDLVSSYDDLEQNSDRLLKRIGVANKIKFPKRSQSYKHKGTEELLRQYYSHIPRAMLEQLAEVYYSDFLMFNYKVPKSLRNLTKWHL